MAIIQVERKVFQMCCVQRIKDNLMLPWTERRVGES